MDLSIDNFIFLKISGMGRNFIWWGEDVCGFGGDGFMGVCRIAW